MKRLTKNNYEIEWKLDPSTGELVRVSTQRLTPEFFDELKVLQQMNAAKGRIGEIMHVCRIPGSILRKWQAEGFDPFVTNEDDQTALMERLREMTARLKRDNQENFIIDKRTF